MAKDKSIDNWREREYLSIRDIERILNVSHAIAFHIAESLPAVKFGPRCRRFPTKAFIYYLDLKTEMGRM